MKKRRCLRCKEYALIESMIRCNSGWFHNIDCMTEYGLTRSRKAKAANEKKADAERKREFRLNDLRIRRRYVKEVCHKYIRLRDKDEPCICCGQPLKPDFHAGHFLESGNNPKIRYNEDNINGQNLHCNYFKGGPGEYEKNLRAKIGDKRVDFLIVNKGGTMKRTGKDLKYIEDHYKQLIKEMESCEMRKML